MVKITRIERIVLKCDGEQLYYRDHKAVCFNWTSFNTMIEYSLSTVELLDKKTKILAALQFQNIRI